LDWHRTEMNFSRFIILIMVMIQTPLHAHEILRINDGITSKPINNYFQYFIDEDASLSIEEVSEFPYLQQFASRDINSSSFGFIGTKAIWAVIKVENTENKEKEIILEHRYASTDYISVYLKNNSEKWSKKIAGDRVPFINRDISYRFPSFSLVVPPGQTSIYIKIESEGSVSFPFYIWNVDQFQNYAQTSIGFASFLFGGLILILLYNAFLVLSMRSDRSYIYYILYLLSMVLFQLATTGLGQQIFEPTAKSSWISNEGIALSIDLCTITAIFFSINFLEMRKNIRLAYYGFLAVACVMPINMFTSYFVNYNISIRFSVAILAICSTGLLICGIILSLRKYRSAYFYSLAWTSLLVGNLVTIGVRLGQLPENQLTEWSHFIGVVIEALFLSFALGDRVNMEKKQKYLDILNQKNKNQHLLSQLEHLVYPHQVQIINNGKSIIDTMPVGKSSAVVITLDILDSAKIGHTENHAFFEHFLRQCHEIMSRNYDPHMLRANAYMVKEIGDGFICSIGFPFELDGNIFDHSYMLANQFLDAFKSSVETFLTKKNVFCAIGIAYGDVTGFFPKNGLKTYDLYGEAIIKAKRYEAFRNVLFQQLKIDKQSVILIQDQVYQNLTNQSQENLRSFTLDKLKVRDDESAKLLYFRLIGTEFLGDLKRAN